MSTSSIQPDSLEIHPDAHLIPLMADKEYEEFKQDIKDNGQQMPVTVFNNMILDGRHRARACKELGIALLAEPLSDTKAVDTVAMVLSLNLQRRQLTMGQRAAIASDIANMSHGGDRKSGEYQEGETPLDSESETPLYTREEAAVHAGAKVRDIPIFRKLEEEAPDLAAQVRSGETPIYTARSINQKRTKNAREEKKAAKAVEKKKKDPAPAKEETAPFADWVESLKNKQKTWMHEWMLATKTEAKAEAHEIRNEADKKYESVQQVRRMLEKEQKMLNKPFTKEEFKMIRAMLHPDKHPDNQERAQRAFELFNRILEKSCG